MVALIRRRSLVVTSDRCIHPVAVVGLLQWDVAFEAV